MLIVDSFEEKKSSYGKISLLNCRPSTPEDNGKRVICPARYSNSSLYPCIMIYLGMAEMLTFKNKNGVDGDNGSSGKKTQQKRVGQSLDNISHKCASPYDATVA